MNGGMTPTHTIRFIYSSELIHNVSQQLTISKCSFKNRSKKYFIIIIIFVVHDKYMQKCTMSAVINNVVHSRSLRFYSHCCFSTTSRVLFCFSF